MSDNSCHESCPPLVRPRGVYGMSENPPSSSQVMAPAAPPESPAMLCYFEQPPGLPEDIHRSAIPPLLEFGVYEEGPPAFLVHNNGRITPSRYDGPPGLPNFHEFTASQPSHLFPDQAILTYALPHQHLGTDGWLPFNSFEHEDFFSDGISDAQSHWSGSMSQHPGIHPGVIHPGVIDPVISPTSQPGSRHPRNTKPKQKQPVLRDFEELERDITTRAKETFLATAFSSGLFFYHRRSKHSDAFRTMCRDIFTLTAQQKNCVDITVAERHVVVMLKGLALTRLDIKRGARLIVEEQYGLCQTKNAEGATEIPGLIWEQGIALKVQGLLDGSGPSNMAFTDGEADRNGNPGRWNHHCCREIISTFFFKNSSSMGQVFTARFGPPFSSALIAFGHTMAYVCLEEWLSGIWVNKTLEAKRDEEIYNNFLAGISKAEALPDAGPMLKAMYHDWWRYALKTNGLDDSGKRFTVRKTYAAQGSEMGQSGSTLQTSISLSTLGTPLGTPLSAAPQAGSFSEISFYGIPNSSAASSEAISLAWAEEEMRNLSAGPN